MGYCNWVEPTLVVLYDLKEQLEDVINLTTHDGSYANHKARLSAMKLLEEIDRGKRHYAAVASEGYKKLEARDKRRHHRAQEGEYRGE